MNRHLQIAKSYNRARAKMIEQPPMLVTRRTRMLGSIAAIAIVAGASFMALRPSLGAYQPEQIMLGAAGAWTFYNEAKKYLLNGGIDVDTSSFRMSLYTSASNAATATLSTHGSVTNEIADGNGYSTSGKAMANVTWTVGASASEYRFSFDSVVWTASGGSIANIRYAVLWITGASAGARKLLARSALSTAQFTVTTGNTLTISPSANGIFEVN